MSSNIILNGLSLEDLQSLIKEAVTEALKNTEAPHPAKTENEFITISEACEILQVSRPTLWRYEKEGKINVYGIGGRRLLKRDEVFNSITLKK